MGDIKNEECSICLEELISDITILVCSHRFHKKCINSWIKIKPNCPICRNFIPLNCIHFKARKLYNIFIRYSVLCLEDYLIIRCYFLEFFYKKIILKYSLITKIRHMNGFFNIMYKEQIGGTVIKILKIKIINNTNDNVFYFLKNKIQIIN